MPKTSSTMVRHRPCKGVHAADTDLHNLVWAVFAYQSMACYYACVRVLLCKVDHVKRESSSMIHESILRGQSCLGSQFSSTQVCLSIYLHMPTSLSPFHRPERVVWPSGIVQKGSLGRAGSSHPNCALLRAWWPEGRAFDSR